MGCLFTNIRPLAWTRRRFIPAPGGTPAPATASTDSDDDAEPAPGLRWRSLVPVAANIAGVADYLPGIEPPDDQ